MTFKWQLKNTPEQQTFQCFFEYPVPSWHWNSILPGKLGHQIPSKAIKMDPGSVAQFLYICWPGGTWGFSCIWFFLFSWARWSNRSGLLEQNSHRNSKYVSGFYIRQDIDWWHRPYINQLLSSSLSAHLSSQVPS